MAQPVRKRTADIHGDALSFKDLLLPTSILRSLENAGYVRPSPVQHAAIPLARLGIDVIVQAKAGTGKTLVFAIAAVEKVDTDCDFPQVLILAPTREVALQAAEVISHVVGDADIHNDDASTPVTVATFIGGLPTSEDERLLRRTCHIIVGTPGRVLALIHRGTLVTSRMTLLVLDEADRLLGEDFASDVNEIISRMPSATRQVLALSATYSEACMTTLRRLMRRPQEVLLCGTTVALLGVTHYFKVLQIEAAAGRDEIYACKLSAALVLLNDVSFQQAVLFCNVRSDAETLAMDLTAAGHSAACLSSAKDQLQRIHIVNALRAYQLRIVVATDVAARGVDFDRVDLVVNVDLPQDPETLMHRLGRAGRFGRYGTAITLLRGETEQRRLHEAIVEIAGGQVLPLPDELPIGWSASDPPPASIRDGNALDTNSEKYRIQYEASTTGTSSDFVQHDTVVDVPSEHVCSNNGTGIMEFSLWPDDQLPFPVPQHWPLGLTDLSPAFSFSTSRPGMPDGGVSMPQAVEEHEHEAGGAPSVMPRVERATTPSSREEEGHYELVARSAYLDVQGTESARETSVQLLQKAFENVLKRKVPGPYGGMSTSCIAEKTPGFCPKRQPLGSAQANAYAVQQMQPSEMTLAQEAALLEAMAEGNLDLEDELEGNSEGTAEAQSGQFRADSEVDTATMDAWRDYWWAHYKKHGYWPGGSPQQDPVNASPGPAHPVPSHGTEQQRFQLGNWSPGTGPPPSLESLRAGPCGDIGGYARVPVQLLQRYLQLEWQEWQRRFYTF